MRRSELSTVDIYTDGGCHTRSGVGGWAAMVYEGPRPTEISGHETDTTNQRMELRAAIEGLKHLEDPRQVRLFSDSAYLINGMIPNPGDRLSIAPTDGEGRCR